MQDKKISFLDLCNDVKNCTVCKNVMFSPHLEGSNCFVHATSDEKDECVNFWNHWQGSLDAEIMVIGQDYGIANGEFVTDKSLVKLFKYSFEFNINEKDDRLFFTNIANCYRKNKSTGSLNKGCLAICSNKFIGRLIRIISPKIIIVLGQETFNALSFCDNANLICKNPTNENEKDSFADIINHKYELVLDNKQTISVFPVYHPGALGKRNRSYKLQLNDWKKISDFYKENRYA